MSSAALSDFEILVSHLVNRGWRRDVAEREVRRQKPELAPPVDAGARRDDTIAEKQEQLQIVKLAIAHGFRVYQLSQPRASKQTPGLADLWLAHLRVPVSLWWETKRQVGGELSPAQQIFREDCLRTNTGYGTGDRYAFVEKLIELELAARGAGPYGIIPIRDVQGVP